MPVLADLVNDLIALIPEDGSRITNDQIRVALEQEAGEPLSDALLKDVKDRVVAMRAAEKPRGPGGGLKAPGVSPPPRASAPAAVATAPHRPRPAPPSPPAPRRPLCSPASCATRSTGSGMPMEDRDTKGDIYEYMLGKLATAGTNGQFRTPRHIIELMVAMTEPTPRDVMVDPACGTCGFPVAVGEYLREHHPELLSDPELREHFNHGLFHGFDFDNTMLRIGAMNMLLHGVENPDVSYRDSLAEDTADEENKYTLILANPPFVGSLDYESTSAKLQRVVNTRKTELLFMALFLQLLKPGGRAAVIVPDGVLFGSSKAHKELRRTLVEEHFLEGVVSLPSGVFRPYAGVSTAILFFTKTCRGGTDQVWFYDMTADGWSLDDRRNPLLPLEKLGPAPNVALAEGEQEKNNLPDCLARWRQRQDSERERERTAQSFCVPKAEIAAEGYDLNLNRYKELVHEEVEHRPPLEILAELRGIEQEILRGIEELEGMLR